MIIKEILKSKFSFYLFIILIIHTLTISVLAVDVQSFTNPSDLTQTLTIENGYHAKFCTSDGCTMFAAEYGSGGSSGYHCLNNNCVEYTMDKDSRNVPSVNWVSKASVSFTPMSYIESLQTDPNINLYGTGPTTDYYTIYYWGSANRYYVYNPSAYCGKPHQAFTVDFDAYTQTYYTYECDPITPDPTPDPVDPTPVPPAPVVIVNANRGKDVSEPVHIKGCWEALSRYYWNYNPHPSDPNFYDPELVDHSKLPQWPNVIRGYAGEYQFCAIAPGSFEGEFFIVTYEVTNTDPESTDQSLCGLDERLARWDFPENVYKYRRLNGCTMPISLGGDLFQFQGYEAFNQ